MRRTLMGLGVLFLAVPFASAQTRPRARTIPIQFQFAPPGARALAMGATFVAIADDATAAESNPAGLTILTKPEISAHFRTSRFEPEFVNPFNIDETATFATKVYSRLFQPRLSLQERRDLGLLPAGHQLREQRGLLDQASSSRARPRTSCPRRPSSCSTTSGPRSPTS
jgi:hypothetical protein